MILSRSRDCKWCGPNHENLCFVVYNSGEYCFSCHNSSSKPEGSFAFRTQKKLVGVDNKIWIPAHTFNINEFSATALQWLYSYYVYDDVIKDYSIAYCPAQADKPESLLLPILNEVGEVMHYQRRFFPKAFYGSPGVKKSLFTPGSVKNAGSTIILVEDYISAIRVGQFWPTMCLFGTSLSSLHASYLIRYYKNVYIWLDNDEPGINASREIAGQLEYSALNFIFKNIQIKEVHTTKQPKELSPREIQEQLQKVMNDKKNNGSECAVVV